MNALLIPLAPCARAGGRGSEPRGGESRANRDPRNTPNA